MLPPVLTPDGKVTGVSDSGLLLRMLRYIFLGNFLGLPGHSAPVGTALHPETSAALPVGLHLLGKPWSEHTLLRLAAALDDDAIAHHHRPPAGAFFEEGILASVH